MVTPFPPARRSPAAQASASTARSTAILPALILWLAVLSFLAPVAVSGAGAPAPRVLAAIFAAILLAFAGVGVLCAGMLLGPIAARMGQTGGKPL